MSELADSLEHLPSSTSDLVAELRSELLLSTGQFLVPLDEDEFQALKDDIAKVGVRVPVVLGQHLRLIDGRHRLLAAQEVGVSEVPALLVTDLSAEEEHELAVSLNAARRQLDFARRAKLVEHELVRDPGRSDRRIAAVCGVNRNAVGDIRARLKQEQETAQAAQVDPESLADAAAVLSARDSRTAAKVAAHGPPPHVDVDPDVRVDARGAARRPAEVARPPAPPAPEPEQRLGFVECAHGQRHTLWRDGAGYRIEGC